MFTPMVFSRNKSISIFGLRAVLEDPGESSAADWSCLLFLLGENNEIAAVTETVTMRFVHNTVPYNVIIMANKVLLQSVVCMAMVRELTLAFTWKFPVSMQYMYHILVLQ